MKKFPYFFGLFNLLLRVLEEDWMALINSPLVSRYTWPLRENLLKDSIVAALDSKTQFLLVPQITLENYSVHQEKLHFSK